MIMGKFAAALRKQDWVMVFVEILIVIIGVYLGIFIDEAQDERELQADVNQALTVLHAQLQADLAQLDEVIATQVESRTYQEQVIDMLGQQNIDLSALDDIMVDVFLSNSTFYPNRSAYQSMRDMGYLSEIAGPGLGLLISNLYESTLTRQDSNASGLDDSVRDLQFYVRDENWDRYGQDFIGDPKTAAIKIRNGFRYLRGTAGYYLDILMNQVRPEMVNVINATRET